MCQHSDLLGAARHLARFGHGSEMLLNTSEHLFKQFSTIAVPGGMFCNKVYQKLRQRCHIVTTDAADDEVLASELMRQPVSAVFWGAHSESAMCLARQGACLAEDEHDGCDVFLRGEGGVGSGGGRAASPGHAQIQCF